VSVKATPSIAAFHPNGLTLLSISSEGENYLVGLRGEVAFGGVARLMTRVAGADRGLGAGDNRLMQGRRGRPRLLDQRSGLLLCLRFGATNRS
jgi:hypothetical protein